MTSPTRYCACGCGAPVVNKWARGHSARGVARYAATPESGPQPMPGPDDPVWDDDTVDVGELVPDDAEPVPIAPGVAEPAPEPPRETGPAAPDPPPAHGKREWRKAAREPGPRPKMTRITAAVRTDIDAKISFALEVPGRVWQAKDPLCGGMFVQQRPDISAALTEIVCQSPDLVAWFAGTGGQFMLWMNLAAAMWPVATVVMGHHVYHTMELGEAPQPGQEHYAA